MTNETKHTPGPWIVKNELILSEINRSVIADVLHDADINPLNNRKAHARLIAAAPYLLQTLERIALHAPSLDVQGIREACDEAIAKARGEA